MENPFQAVQDNRGEGGGVFVSGMMSQKKSKLPKTNESNRPNNDDDEYARMGKGGGRKKVIRRNHNQNHNRGRK